MVVWHCKCLCETWVLFVWIQTKLECVLFSEIPLYNEGLSSVSSSNLAAVTSYNLKQMSYGEWKGTLVIYVDRVDHIDFEKKCEDDF